MEYFFMLILIGIIIFSCVGKMNPQMLVMRGGNPGAMKDLTLYYAPWCGHCKRLMPEWEQVETILAADPAVKVNKINSDEFPHLAKREGITGFPTIVFANAQGKQTYKGDRTAQAIIDFVKNG
jgi:protein disulfide-isomerase-like protein